MGKRAARRMLVVVAAPLIAIAIGLFGFGGTASAHEVTSITADCDRVTVHFSGFPEAGVMVHIAAVVSGHAAITSDVLVTSATSEAHVDISAATATLFGATASVDVDVTWTLEGPQHVHETLTVTCGSSTTTTQATTTSSGPTTSTTVGGVTSTSTPIGTTTTAPTSITVAGVTMSTAARNAVVSGSTTIPSSGLPRTGASTTPLLGVALALAVVGATAIGAATRR
jgi:hypothetical protein